MSLKRFLAPNVATLVILAILWLSGVDSLFMSYDKDRQNIKKFMDVNQKIVENYVDEVNENQLFKNAIRNMVSNLSDTTLTVSNTPIDTTFEDLRISSLNESVSKFEQAYQYVKNNSEEEDLEKLTENAVKGLFKNLDPHSIYIEAKQSEQIQAEFDGKFQGIGVQFQIIEDTIRVISAISGGPSEKLGIQSGDRIVEIEGENAVGFSEQDVQDRLRGEKGTNVKVGIKRPFADGILEFDIERDEIPIHTVDSSHMLDDKTGYIKINRFAATTHQEFMDGMSEMEDEGMERIILDMRGNPGGYLEQAIRIANEFFPRNTELVSTKSRHPQFTSNYRSRADGRYKDMPVIVLINGGSASGSEIVSGAIQDHDRGLIVGSRSFGKGLVQQQFEMDDRSNIRVTISRYFTPSGRLIQRPYKDGREAYAYELAERSHDVTGDVDQFIENIPDSLKYETKAGRTVYGGGGIIPDHIIQPDFDKLSILMNRTFVHSEFVRNYIDNKGPEFRETYGDDFDKFLHEFTWDSEDRENIKAKLKDRGMVIDDDRESPELEDNKLYISTEDYNESMKRSEIYVKAELARNIWGMHERFIVLNKGWDKTVEVAKNLWDDVQALTAAVD